MKIVLASKSPRRKDLLHMIGLDFTVDAVDVNEVFDENLSPHEVVMYLSKLKAESMQSKHPDSLIIGSDTIVTINNQILGKPLDRDDAYHMLNALSGKTHHVMTGVTLITPTKIDTFYSETKVHFYEMTHQEIVDYIETKEPFDKAGAYAIQGYASKFIHSIEGDYFTVVGLPVSMIYQKLKVLKKLL